MTTKIRYTSKILGSHMKMTGLFVTEQDLLFCSHSENGSVITKPKTQQVLFWPTAYTCKTDGHGMKWLNSPHRNQTSVSGSYQFT